MSFILAVLLGAVGDRLRGGLWHKPLRLSNKLWGALCFGGAMAALGIEDPLQLSWLALAYFIGSGPGWGEPLGSYLRDTAMRKEKLEWWQVGPLAKDVELALLTRGAVWGLPVGVVLADGVVVLVFSSAMLIAPALLKRFWFKDSWNAWQKQEWLRGAIVILGIGVIV